MYLLLRPCEFFDPGGHFPDRRMLSSLLGGSAYYVLSGFWLCFTTYLFLRRDRTAALLYFVYFLATWIWAFFEVGGFKGWLLLPRVNVVSGMMIVMALPVVLRQVDGNAAHSKKSTTDAAFGRVNQLLGRFCRLGRIFKRRASPSSCLDHSALRFRPSMKSSRASELQYLRPKPRLSCRRGRIWGLASFRMHAGCDAIFAPATNYNSECRPAEENLEIQGAGTRSKE